MTPGEAFSCRPDAFLCGLSLHRSTFFSFLFLLKGYQVIMWLMRWAAMFFFVLCLRGLFRFHPDGYVITYTNTLYSVWAHFTEHSINENVFASKFKSIKIASFRCCIVCSNIMIFAPAIFPPVYSGWNHIRCDHSQRMSSPRSVFNTQQCCFRLGWTPHWTQLAVFAAVGNPMRDHVLVWLLRVGRGASADGGLGARGRVIM